MSIFIHECFQDAAQPTVLLDELVDPPHADSAMKTLRDLKLASRLNLGGPQSSKKGLPIVFEILAGMLCDNFGVGGAYLWKRVGRNLFISL